MHDITIIVTFDCRGNYSGSQQKRAKREMLNKLERVHLQQVLSCKSLAECFTEKKKNKKKDNIFIILRRMATEETEQEPLVCYNKELVYDR